MPSRILVVDDEAHIVQVLTLKLRNAGYEVLTAADGEEALDLARRERPDLVVTDFQPSELAKIAYVLVLANYRGARRAIMRGHDSRRLPERYRGGIGEKRALIGRA